MKAFSYYIFILTLAAIMYSCDVIEPSQNGGLSGRWHLMSVDTLATGGTKDCSADALYWDIEGNLLHVKWYFTRITNKDKVLYTEGLFVEDFGNDDPTTEDVTPLQPYGINALNESYEIERNSGGRLVLKSPLLRLFFRKF